nr:hypothetical protein 14 [bacterium]
MAEKTYKPLLMDSMQVQTDIEKQRFIGFDGNYCANNAKALGVSDVEMEAGQYAPVAINGILLIKTAGAIAIGEKVASNADGYAVTLSGGAELNGYALDAAVSAGEVIRIARGI